MTLTCQFIRYTYSVVGDDFQLLIYAIVNNRSPICTDSVGNITEVDGLFTTFLFNMQLAQLGRYMVTCSTGEYS